MLVEESEKASDIVAIGPQRMRARATFMGERVGAVLPLMFDVVRKPQLAEEH